MKERITIDGFEFEPTFSDTSPLENLNYFLENKFNRFDIKDFISRHHPELFPNHIGLQSNNNLEFSIVEWEFVHCGFEISDRGWYCHIASNPEKYRNLILEFYETADPAFFHFIKDKITCPPGNQETSQ